MSSWVRLAYDHAPYAPKVSTCGGNGTGGRSHGRPGGSSAASSRRSLDSDCGRFSSSRLACCRYKPRRGTPDRPRRRRRARTNPISTIRPTRPTRCWRATGSPLSMRGQTTTVCTLFGNVSCGRHRHSALHARPATPAPGAAGPRSRWSATPRRAAPHSRTCSTARATASGPTPPRRAIRALRQRRRRSPCMCPTAAFRLISSMASR